MAAPIETVAQVTAVRATSDGRLQIARKGLAREPHVALRMLRDAITLIENERPRLVLADGSPVPQVIQEGGNGLGC